MIRPLCFIVASLLFSFAWLSPFHTYPWVMFSSELASFAAGLALLFPYLNQSIKIARAQLWMLAIVCIPLIQWGAGGIADLSTALLGACYLLMFWLMIVAGYQLSRDAQHRQQFMQGLSYVLVAVALLSAIMAILQGLNLESHVYGLMQLKGNRPYANFGQPNNLATFLIMGLMGALYLYEQHKAKLWLLIPSSLVILFSICLTQSRTSGLVCIFIFCYWIYKQYKHQPRLNFPKLLFWCAAYFAIAGYLLPVMTHFMAADIGADVVHTASVVERAGKSHERIGMWIQILHAIAERPWWGYGWNQTSVAVVESIHFNTVQVWFNSAHNVLLDILVWNGIPLGTFIIVYLAAWLFWLNQNAKDTISIVAILMVSAILIHAMLEFPQRYACFLLPMGFLLGLIQAQSPNLNGITLNKHILRCVWLIALVVLLLIWRDYKVFQENSRLVFKGQPPTQQVLGSDQIVLLTQFQQRLDWIQLNPKTQMSEADLTKLGKMVANKATPYNLKKYAQLLAYNQKIPEAQQQLLILNQLYRKHVTLAEIVAK